MVPAPGAAVVGVADGATSRLSTTSRIAGAQPTAAVSGGSTVDCDSLGTGDDSDRAGCSVGCWDDAGPGSLGTGDDSDGAGVVGPVGPVGSAVAVRSGPGVGDGVGAGVPGA